ncbi:MAG TPA: copper amine oxidase N-terminal domain-containing protein [Tissierellia bacterium]|nr:copper amine oxidase N-terminal domain-containing protein [Tissierellia bacterium]
MKSLTKYLLFTLLAVMAFSVSVMAEGSSFKVFINGKPLHYVDVIVQNGRTLVPVESICEELGIDVEYIHESKVVQINKNNKNIEIYIDSTKAQVNGKEVELDVKPFFKEGKIFVPIRFISESLGEEVTWDGENRIVLVGRFSGEAKIEDTFIYFNEKLGYTLSFPNYWQEEAIIDTKDDGTLYVYDKKSAERFIEDGYTSFGPVLEIRCSDYPVIATVPYDGYLLGYKDGKYIEAIFGRDFQYYPETADSYSKIFNEAQQVLGSFTIIDENNPFVEDNKDNYKMEVGTLEDIINNFVPDDIFNEEEITTYRYPISNASFLYLRIMKNEDEVSIKIEASFDESSNLTRYHLKNYWYDLEDNKISQSEALKLANSFIHKYVDETVEVIKKPDLYPSLYEKDKHESYGDEDGKYIIVVDLEHGFVEYFSEISHYEH